MSHSITSKYFPTLSGWIAQFLGQNSDMTASEIGNNKLVKQVIIYLYSTLLALSVEEAGGGGQVQNGLYHILHVLTTRRHQVIKLPLRPSNPQLILATLQIQCIHSLSITCHSLLLTFFHILLSSAKLLNQIEPNLTEDDP